MYCFKQLHMKSLRSSIRNQFRRSVIDSDVKREVG